MTLLLHTCCAPCLVAPYYHLKKDFDITVFWYNHNIHPTDEYRHRRDSVRDFTKTEDISYIEKDDYGLKKFLTCTYLDEENRCMNCYRNRLSDTAQVAVKNGFSAFSTTLLYSKYQRHELIRRLGEELATEYKVQFYYDDLRAFWQKGITLSKEKHMYRQKYCGCIFSEYERYEKKWENTKNLT